MSDPEDVPPPAAASDVPPDRPWIQPASKQKEGASIGAVILFGLSFLSLLSTGCFGIFAIGINEAGLWVVLAIGALVMACVTAGLFFGARALQRRARNK